MTLAAQPYAQVAAFGLSAGAVFGLLALGLVLIYRTTGVLNFAHWAIGLLGLVVYALITGAGVPAPVGVVIALAVSVIGGVAAYRVVFRGAAGVNQIVLILISIGVAQLYSSVGGMILGFEQFTILRGWIPIYDWRIAGVAFRSSEVLTFASAIGIAFGFLVWFRRSRAGKALRAVAQNREAAELVGIDDVRYSSIAWGIGSALAALALLLVFPHAAGERGGLISTADLTPLGTLLIPAFGAALVGGLVHLPMALVGGFVFGLSQELLVLAPAPWSQLRSTIAAALIVVLLVMRTERFFATRQELEALEA